MHPAELATFEFERRALQRMELRCDREKLGDECRCVVIPLRDEVPLLEQGAYAGNALPKGGRCLINLLVDLDGVAKRDWGQPQPCRCRGHKSRLVDGVAGIGCGCRRPRRFTRAAIWRSHGRSIRRESRRAQRARRSECRGGFAVRRRTARPLDILPALKGGDSFSDQAA